MRFIADSYSEKEEILRYRSEWQKKEAQNGWKKKAQMLSWAKRKNDSFFVTLFLPVIFFYLSPFFTCHPEAKPKGLRDSSPSAQNDKKRAQNDRKVVRMTEGGSERKGFFGRLRSGV